MSTVQGVSSSDVKKELDRILASKSFVRSPILSRFLRFIVEKVLEGEENQIKEYTVGTAVLFKPQNFNPQADPSVRIHAIRLRKLLEDYYNDVHWNGSVRIFLQKGSYAPVFSAGGRPTSIELPSGSQNSMFSEGWMDESICVIPFSGLFEDPAPDFSIDGFCGFLSQRLSLFQDIAVKSYFSVSSYIENGGTIEQVGQDLNVTYYLTGSIRISNDQTIVSVQLIHAKSNAFIWSHDFNATGAEGSLADVLNKIVNDIVVSLAGYSGVVHNHLLLNGSRATALSNTQAKSVFWFYHYLTRQNEEVFREALNQLEQTVLEDSNSSLCWSVLAMLYVDSIFFNYDAHCEDPLNRAQEYVNRALEIDPDCQHGNITLGWINIFLKNKELAYTALEKAYEINPNASYFTAACSLGMALLGEYDRSKEFLEKAIPMNPLPYWWLNLPFIFGKLKNGEYETMLFQARKVGTPAGIQEHILEMIALYYLNDKVGLEQLIRKYIKKYPNGIEHALVSWPMILFDQELIDKITSALEEILALKKTLAN